MNMKIALSACALLLVAGCATRDQGELHQNNGDGPSVEAHSYQQRIDPLTNDNMGGISAVAFLGRDEFAFVRDTKCKDIFEGDDQLIDACKNGTLQWAEDNGAVNQYLGLLTYDFISQSGVIQNLTLTFDDYLKDEKTIDDLEAACALGGHYAEADGAAVQRFLIAESTPNKDGDGTGRIFEIALLNRTQASIVQVWEYKLRREDGRQPYFVVEGMACKENADDTIDVWLAERGSHNILGKDEGYPEIPESGIHFQKLGRVKGAGRASQITEFNHFHSLVYGPTATMNTSYLPCVRTIADNKNWYKNVGKGDKPTQRNMSTLLMDWTDAGELNEVWSAATVDGGSERVTCSRFYEICEGEACQNFEMESVTPNTPHEVLRVENSASFDFADDRVEGVDNFETFVNGVKISGRAFAIDNDDETYLLMEIE